MSKIWNRLKDIQKKQECGKMYSRFNIIYIYMNNKPNGQSDTFEFRRSVL